MKYQIEVKNMSTGRIESRGIEWEERVDAEKELAEWYRNIDLSRYGEDNLNGDETGYEYDNRYYSVAVVD